MNQRQVVLAMTTSALLLGCAPSPQPSVSDEPFDHSTMGIRLKKVKRGIATPNAGPYNAHLKYYGGPVLPSVEVTALFWSPDTLYQTELTNFYGAIAPSAYLDWLSEYATANASITHGSFKGAVVDSAAPAGTDITNQQVQAELSRLIDAGELPQPNGNNITMIHFPPGVTITQDDGSASCEEFCAYHFTFVKGGRNVQYAVIPDFSGACSQGCSDPSEMLSELDMTQVSASHELVEAITDPAIGILISSGATSLGAPVAWMDPRNGEIGDICAYAAPDAKVAGFMVQAEWSNQLGSCITTAGGCTPDCTNAVCGGDGCGGSCGECASGELCSGGQCAACTPQCDNAVCGDDGCGGSCGDCQPGEVCQSGACVGGNGGEAEPNNALAKANGLYAASVRGAIQPAGDVDWYSFEVPAGAQYTLQLSALAADYTMTVYHVAATGTLSKIGSAVDNHDLADQSMTHVSRVGGTYYLKVAGASGAETSAQPYRVSVALE